GREPRDRGARADGRGLCARGDEGLRQLKMARLVTFDDGKVGELRGDKIARLDVPTMREYFERDAPPGPTGEEFALEEVRLRAPIVPKKFFHTAGNFREHEEESKQGQWSHRIAPW